MEDRRFNYHKVKKKYLKFLTSQEVMSEPFRDKLGQLNKFYLDFQLLYFLLFALSLSLFG